MQASDRYVVRRNREAPSLWDVADTMHDNTPVLGGEALPEMHARECGTSQWALLAAGAVNECSIFTS